MTLLVVSIPAVGDSPPSDRSPAAESGTFSLERMTLQDGPPLLSEETFGLAESLGRARESRQGGLSPLRTVTTLDQILRAIEWRRAVATELDRLAP